ncbi:MAG: CBASS cGAMP synthase [bacterium]|nr:CBASS cGAMP synthase [bacterium]
MADLAKQFKSFNEKIKLSESKKQSLRESRNALRKDIRAELKDQSDISVKFAGQGSYVLNTIVEPENGEYDIDDGVYFSCAMENRPSVKDAHSIVVSAVQRRKRTVEDKPTCVRVKYQDDRHIDMPIYFLEKLTEKFSLTATDSPDLAHKKLGWVESDPRAFIEWFREKTGNNSQLIRLIRYLKVWREVRSKKYELPSGFCLTILTVNHYRPAARDDQSLVATLQAIQNVIDDRHLKWGQFTCTRPTPKREDLFEDFSDEQKEFFLGELELLLEDGKIALEDEDEYEACKIWAKYLGPRFKCDDLKSKRFERAKKHAKATSLPGNASSAKQ